MGGMGGGCSLDCVFISLEVKLNHSVNLPSSPSINCNNDICKQKRLCKTADPACNPIPTDFVNTCCSLPTEKWTLVFKLGEERLFVWTKINLCLYCSTEQAAFKWSDLQISMKCLAELGVVSNFTSWQSYLNWESVLKNFVKVTQFHLKYSCTFLRIFECLQVETPSALPSLITSLAINNYKLQIFQNIHGRNEPVESELFGCNNLSQFQAFLTLTTQLWAELSTNVKIFHFIFPFHV